MEIEDSSEIGPDLSRTTEGIIFEMMLGDMEDKTAEGEYGNDSYRHDGYNRGRDRPRERPYSRIYSGNRTRSASSSRSRSGSRASSNRDRIRCYNCREYDHFARECPNSREKRDLDQMQQMLNLEEEEQTHLLSSRQSSPMENSRTSPFNL